MPVTLFVDVPNARVAANGGGDYLGYDYIGVNCTGVNSTKNDEAVLVTPKECLRIHSQGRYCFPNGTFYTDPCRILHDYRLLSTLAHQSLHPPPCPGGTVYSVTSDTGTASVCMAAGQLVWYDSEPAGNHLDFSAVDASVPPAAMFTIPFPCPCTGNHSHATRSEGFLNRHQ